MNTQHITFQASYHLSNELTNEYYQKLTEILSEIMAKHISDMHFAKLIDNYCIIDLNTIIHSTQYPNKNITIKRLMYPSYDNGECELINPKTQPFVQIQKKLFDKGYYLYVSFRNNDNLCCIISTKLPDISRMKITSHLHNENRYLYDKIEEHEALVKNFMSNLSDTYLFQLKSNDLYKVCRHLTAQQLQQTQLSIDEFINAMKLAESDSQFSISNGSRGGLNNNYIIVRKNRQKYKFGARKKDFIVSLFDKYVFQYKPIEINEN